MSWQSIRQVDTEIADNVKAYIWERDPEWVASRDISRDVISLSSNQGRSIVSRLLSTGVVEDKYDKDVDKNTGHFIRYYRKAVVGQ